MKRSCTISSKVLSAYGLDEASEFRPLTSGHINCTYLVRSGKKQYILQRINRFVFPSPPDIMENILGITEFLKKKIILQGGDPERETLSVVQACDGKYYLLDEEGEYWRCVNFVEGASAHETADRPELLFEAGRAFGNFQRMLSDYPAETLHEILPGFHNTPKRFQQLTAAVERASAERLSRAFFELQFAQQRKERCGLLMGLLERGALPLRVTHNDTKLSNVLLDNNSGHAVCVIDLDTVMPGLAAFDFGDSIRAGATAAAEDETDLSKIRFEFSRFEAYAKGFLSAVGNSLTEKELETLPDGAWTMTYETGIRFLTDYLNGDVYFQTKYPEHNLDRARNQLKLTADLEEHMPEMRSVISQLAKKYC